MKDESDRKIMTKLVGLSAKPYIIDDGSEDKKAKGTKKCVIKMCHKKTLKFENYKNCLEATQIENKINYLEKKNKIDSLKKIIKNS